MGTLHAWNSNTMDTLIRACRGDSGGPMTTEIGGFYVQLALIHGAVFECTNRISGIFVRLDNPKILKYIDDEVGRFLPNRSRIKVTSNTI